MTLLAAVPYHTFPDFQLGPVTIRTFGLMVALGIVVGAMLGAQFVGNRGLDPEEYTNLATKVALVGLVGARITWVLSHLDAIQSPIDVIAVWEGGVQFSGGLLFGAAAGWWWSRNRWDRRERWALLDGTAIGLAAGLAIGRIGCMAVGEHFGGPTTFALGMTYRGGGTIEAEPAIGETIHNTAFYEFLQLLVLLAVIAVVLRRAGNRERPLVPGTIGGLFLAWYGIGRFITDFARVNDATAVGLTGAQWASLVLVLVGGWLLATGTRRAQALATEDVPDAAARPHRSTIKVLTGDEADERVEELGGVTTTAGPDEPPTRASGPGTPDAVPGPDAHVRVTDGPADPHNTPDNAPDGTPDDARAAGASAATDDGGAGNRDAEADDVQTDDATTPDDESHGSDEPVPDRADTEVAGADVVTADADTSDGDEAGTEREAAADEESGTAGSAPRRDDIVSIRPDHGPVDDRD